MAFRLLLMTPESRVLDEDVDGLVLPGADGFFGVLARHAPMVAALSAGVATITRGKEVALYVVGDGGVEVGGNRALIVTEAAVKAADYADAESKLEEYLKERVRSPLVTAGSVEG
jgi:F-type H+-transporting ATPase subunit epsilon